MVPVYNRSGTISRTLDSILSQDSVQFEVIVVDDGSTDGTADVVSRYISDPRVRMLRISNGGVGRARNIAISRAVGDYLVFVDSDDLVTHGMLPLLANALAASEPDIAYFGLQFCDSSLRVEHVLSVPDGNWLGKDVRRAFSLLLRCGLFGYMPAAVISREFLERSGVSIREDLRRHSDQYFASELFEHVSSIVALSDAPYIYVQAEDAITAKYMEDLLRIKLDVFHRLLTTIDVLEPLDAPDLVFSAAASSAAAVLSNAARAPRPCSFSECDALVANLAESDIGKALVLRDNRTGRPELSKMQAVTAFMLRAKPRRLGGTLFFALQFALRARDSLLRQRRNRS